MNNQQVSYCNRCGNERKVTELNTFGNCCDDSVYIITRDVEGFTAAIHTVARFALVVLRRAATVVKPHIDGDPSLQGNTPMAKAARTALCREVFEDAWEGDPRSFSNVELMQRLLQIVITIAIVQREEYFLQDLEKIPPKFKKEFEEELQQEALGDGRWVKLGEEGGDSFYYIIQAAVASLLAGEPLEPWLELLRQLLTLVQPYTQKLPGGYSPMRALLLSLTEKMRIRSVVPKTPESLVKEWAAIAQVWGVAPEDHFR